MLENKKNIVELFVIVLIIGYGFFAYNYFNLYQELKTVESTKSKAELNDKVLDFTALFIKEVLQAETEVDFDTRLALENSVRDLKDEEILKEWQKFIGSKTEASAQNSVKSLLGILISKVQK